MKGNPEIKNKITDAIIIPADKYANIREAVEKEKADLSYADLSYADLCSADLRSANLHYANLRSADLCSANLRYADLSSADFCYANLRYADLYYADLCYADLCYADLRYADLSYADLCYADLRYADLSYADLCYAKFCSAKFKEPLFLPDLYLLKLQPTGTKLRAWKYLKNGKSPYQNFEYETGKTYKFDCDLDEKKLCSNGCNVATLAWCLKDNMEADEFLEMEFLASDVIMPWNTDGKFRVKKAKAIRKINREEALAILKEAMI